MKAFIIHSGDNEELVNSLKRYLKFTKGLEYDEIESKDIYNLIVKNEKDYFDEIYPEKFENCQIYFILGKTLERFEENNIISTTNLVTCTMLDIVLTVKNCREAESYKYEIYAIRSTIEDFIKFNENCLEIEFDDKGTVPNFYKINKIKVINKNFIEKEIVHIRREQVSEELYRLFKKNVKEWDEYKKMIKEPQLDSLMLPIEEKDLKVVENTKFVLLIDDVIGDYKRIFLPFYLFIKFHYNNIIVRGVYDPLQISEILKTFPADIILVDISWESFIKSSSTEYLFYFSLGKQNFGFMVFNQVCSLFKAMQCVRKIIPPKIFIFTYYQCKSKIEIWNEKRDFINLIKKEILPHSVKEITKEPELLLRQLVLLKRQLKWETKISNLISAQPIGENGGWRKVLKTHIDFFIDLEERIVDDEIDISTIKIYNGEEDFNYPIIL